MTILNNQRDILVFSKNDFYETLVKRFFFFNTLYYCVIVKFILNVNLYCLTLCCQKRPYTNIG